MSLLVRAQGDPEEWHLWTRRTGVSLYLPCPEMYVPRAGEGGLGREKSDFCRILEFQAGLCLYVTAAVQACLTPPRGQSDRSLFRVRWDPRPPQVHTRSTYIFNEVCIGFPMMCGFIGSRPLHLVPLFILSPFTYICFLLFFHVLLSSCLVISSFLSFARAFVPALVCTCTAYFTT